MVKILSIFSLIVILSAPAYAWPFDKKDNQQDPKEFSEAKTACEKSTGFFDRINKGDAGSEEHRKEAYQANMALDECLKKQGLKEPMSSPPPSVDAE